MPEAAAGTLEPRHVVTPLRDILKRTYLRLGEVVGHDPEAKTVEQTGCFNSDSVAAINQAVADGVDVINFSISGGANPYTDGVELAFLDAFNAGISVNASAGNSGPGAATSDHGGPWVTTVGASTGPRSTP